MAEATKNFHKLPQLPGLSKETLRKFKEIFKNLRNWKAMQIIF